MLTDKIKRNLSLITILVGLTILTKAMPMSTLPSQENNNDFAMNATMEVTQLVKTDASVPVQPAKPHATAPELFSFGGNNDATYTAAEGAGSQGHMTRVGQAKATSVSAVKGDPTVPEQAASSILGNAATNDEPDEATTSGKHSLSTIAAGVKTGHSQMVGNKP